MSNYIHTKLDADQVIRRVYDEPENRLRVDAEVTATIGTVDVIIDADSGDNIAISDGTNTVKVNPNGSLDVNLVQSGSTDLDVVIIDQPKYNTYNEITSVNAGIDVTVLTKLISTEKIAYTVSTSGDLVATYWVELNGNTIDKARTYFGGSPNVTFDLGMLDIVAGDVITVKVRHDRPEFGEFNAKLTLR